PTRRASDLGNYGYAPLERRLAEHAGVPEECVVAAAGTSMANHLAMAALLDPGDEVLIEQPAYGPLLDVANYLGVRIKRLPRRFEARFSIGLEELQRAISTSTRLIVLTNLHNPSGALLSRKCFRPSARWLIAPGCVCLWTRSTSRCSSASRRLSASPSAMRSPA